MNEQRIPAAAARSVPVLAALLLAGVCAAQEVCVVPADVKAPAAIEPDYRNRDKPTDYLALVLSWSPEHCERQRNLAGAEKDPEKKKRIEDRHGHQCFSGNRFEWVVHGLWPQNGGAASSRDHPRHCELSGALPAALVRQHLCALPGADLMQNEWQAHGTCGWRSADAYFADIRRVYGSIRRPTTAQMLGAAAAQRPNRLVELRAGEIKASFAALNPGLTPDKLRVNAAAGNRLKEIWVCLDKALAPQACPPGGTPDAQTIRVRTPH